MNEAVAIPTESSLTHIPAQVAANWARAGFPVFPCRHVPEVWRGELKKAKTPLTEHGFKDATTDLQTIAAWWRQFPNALVGIATGAASGLFVVDLDIDKATGEAIGEASLTALGLSHLIGAVPTVATPSGGRHLYFRDCGLGSTASRVAPKIDTRGDGGYVIAPGSVGPEGAYALLNGKLDPEALTSVPEAIVARLRGIADPDPAQPTLRIDTGSSAASGSLATKAGVAEVAEVIAHIHPDTNYADWVTVLMGLHDHFGGDGTGLSLAREWSARGNMFKPGEVEAKWSGFKLGGGTGFGSVCELARRHGADLSAITRKHRTAPERSNMSAAQRLAPTEAEGTAAPAPFFCAADLHGQAVPERLWHVLDFMPARTVTILTGDGGTGKSLAALQLATATALGRQWLGQATTEGRALFISAEDDRDELHRRVAALAYAEGFALADLHRLTLCSLAGEDALLSIPEGTGKTMKETPLFRKIEEWLAEHRPALTVLDTLADLFGGDEINRAQARQFIGQLRGLALKYETTVLLLAHPSLSGMARGDGNSGSTAWNNSVRSRLYMRRLAGEDGAEADPDARSLEVMKANYGRVGISLSLRYRDGAFFSDGFAGAPDAKATAAKADRVFLKLLRQCHDNGRRVNHTGGNSYAPKVFAAMPEAEGVTHKAFRRAMETALATQAARIETEGPQSRRVSFLVPGDAK